MCKKDMVSNANNQNHSEKLKRIAELYSHQLPEIVIDLLSKDEKGYFLENDNRVLSCDEIIDAEKDLQVDFVKKGIIPIIDCGDNDFIVFILQTNKWAMYNIVDEVLFKKRDSLEDLIPLTLLSYPPEASL